MKNETPKFIMLVGLPGSGKSTWIKDGTTEQSDFVVISTDNYIERKAVEEGSTYSEVFSKYIRQATSSMIDKMRDAVTKRKNIILDQTNLTVKSRRKKLANVPHIYFKEALVFCIPDDELFERLEKRKIEEGKHIPSHVIENMSSSFEMPTEDEGFDEVRLI